LILLYKAVFTRGFVKEFDKLPKTIKEQVIKGLEKAVEDPYAGNKATGKIRRLMTMANRQI
jgi:mRNA-degrading endonuclease RelE of RelBE toxin-antitoxin system